MKNGIISSAGSLRWCTRAEKGPNFDEFIKFVRDEMFPPAAGTDKAFEADDGSFDYFQEDKVIYKGHRTVAFKVL